MAYAAYPAIVENVTDSEHAKSVATDLTVSREPFRDSSSRGKADPNIAEPVEAERNEDTTNTVTQTDRGDDLVDFAEPFFADEMMAERHDDFDLQETATEALNRQDAEEAQAADGDTAMDDLMAFIATSNLEKDVKDTAVRKLTNPNLTRETIALESKPPVANSTAWRRYEKFDTAAREEGFTSPALPDLRSAENTTDRELAAAH